MKYIIIFILGGFVSYCLNRFYSGWKAYQGINKMDEEIKKHINQTK